MNHENNEMHEKEEKILFKEECYQIQGAIFDVYKEIGPGFLESVYQECLEKEFFLRNIPFQKQAEISIKYKKQKLDQFFKADLVCYNSIIVELKACKSIEPIHRAQVINYLKATHLRLGMLINFNAYPKVQIERIVL
ncbi:GxxExxY protein [Marispirochaeta sp.]|uniref:GxxExxY protein n=1 Tax=Marispirochaeta sp. TaxID=2038653 RepID=UPI0029C91A1F|nr:GxxExxY protein [Marispirochaeta sp.]